MGQCFIRRHPLPDLYAPPTWGGGTDEEIVEAVQKADDGDITLSDYWAVGDMRSVYHSAISGSADYSNQFYSSVREGSIGLKILNVGYNEQSNIHFVVGSAPASVLSTRMKTGTEWSRCTIRNALNRNDTYGLYGCISSSIKPIFKDFLTITSTYNDDGINYSTDKVSLLAAKEVDGTGSFGSTSERQYLSQLEYYKTSASRIGNRAWWLRTRLSGGEKLRMNVTSSGNISSTSSLTASYAICPFMCI